MKLLVAGGCSFTEEKFKSYIHPEYDCNFPKWPELVANHLDLKSVNLARGGYGNDYAQIKLAEFILENHKEIDTVCVAWTEAHRFHLYYQWHFNPLVWLEGKEGDPYSDAYNFLSGPWTVGQDLAAKIMQIETSLQLLDKFYDEVFVIQELCKTLGLKFIFSSALSPFDYPKIKSRVNWSFEELVKKTIQSEKFWRIDAATYIGWPTFNPLGGDALVDTIRHNQDLRISIDDIHPSKMGHEWIAKQYIERYHKLYGK